MVYLINLIYLITNRENGVNDVLKILTFNKSLKQSTSVLDSVVQLLLNGAYSEACKICVDNEIWTHALIISKKFDLNVYNNVINQFSASQLTNNNQQKFNSFGSEDQPSLRVFYGAISGNGIASSKI